MDLGLDFYKKLTFCYFMDATRVYETSKSETKDFITHDIETYMNFNMFVLVRLVPKFHGGLIWG